jgi:hypothetical protein
MLVLCPVSTIRVFRICPASRLVGIEAASASWPATLIAGFVGVALFWAEPCAQSRSFEGRPAPTAKGDAGTLPAPMARLFGGGQSAAN